MLPTIPDKLQPQNIEAEEALLGATLIDPDNLIRIAHTGLSPADFFVARNGWLWQALMDLRQVGTAIDLLTITDELERRGQLQPFGGAARITDLISQTPDSQHAAAYADKVKRCSVLRQLIGAAGNISRLAFNEDIEAEEAISKATAFVTDVAKGYINNQTEDLLRLGHKYLDRLEYMQANGNCIIGLPTGLTDLDKLIGGLQRGDMIVLAGRPGMGKSALALQLCLETAQNHRARSLYFNREMSAELQYQRMLAYKSGINVKRLRTNDIKQDEYPALLQAIDELGQLKEYITIDDSTSTPDAMRAAALIQKDKTGLDLVIVDYIQIVEPPAGPKSRSKANEIGDISKALKRLAREVDAPVIAISSLSRNCEYRSDKRPQLSDLRESGDIEHDADIVIFIYRDVIYNPDTELPFVADLNVAKHRQGPTGAVSVYFKIEVTKFLDLELRREPLDWIK